MSAIYNEVDPVACTVLRRLSNENIIAPGLVVERSIKDIHDLDLIGAVQFHAFAGAGLWSVAARLAGWPDDRPLWTASVPCQPFSAAGQQGGFNDPRDLWPDFFRLVRACRPVGLAGEQVASAAGAWLHRARADLESIGYDFQCVSVCAAAVDSPHIRQRLWWVALEKPDSWRETRRSLQRPNESGSEDSERSYNQFRGPDCLGGTLADADSQSRQQVARSSSCDETANGRTRWDECQSNGDHRSSSDDDDESRMANADGGGHRGRQEDPQRVAQRRDAVEWFDEPVEHAAGFNRRTGTRRRNGSQVADANGSDLGDPGGAGLAQRSIADDQRGTLRDEGEAIGQTDHRSFWMDAEWLACADGKARRAKPGVRLLAHGVERRADLWRLCGNSIVPQLAAEVLKALKDEIDSRG